MMAAERSHKTSVECIKWLQAEPAATPSSRPLYAFWRAQGSRVKCATYFSPKARVAPIGADILRL